MIKLGSQEVTKVMKGTEEVSAIYRGSDEVWSGAGDPVYDVQVIGGGGGSSDAGANGYAQGAGGGGGFHEKFDVDAEIGREWTIQIGAGGAKGANGGDSFCSISFGPGTSVGGGAGYGKQLTNPIGGSGSGGKGKLNRGYPGTTGMTYGNNGGDGGGNASTGCGGCGGGASEAGKEAVNASPQIGGKGKLCFDGVRRAGGGGGASSLGRNSGSDGGGMGAAPNQTARAGDPNTGGGAGGTGPNATQSAYGNQGGSGVVLIRTKLTPAKITGGWTKVGQSDGKDVYKFTSSGTITF